MAVELTNTRLGIPRGVESRMFIEVARNILADIHLDRLVKTWMIPELRQSLPPTTQLVTASHCPALWLWPEPRDGQPLSNVSQSFTLNVRIDLYLSGADALDAMDVYDRIAVACYPESEAEGQQLRQRLGEISRWGGISLTQPVYSQIEEGDEFIIHASGSIEVGYRRHGF